MRELGYGQGVKASSWIPYLGVESAQDTVHEAERNGGQILTASRAGPIGRTALLADPQGARFAVLEREVTSPRKRGGMNDVRQERSPTR